ncbi:MAG: haloalkane dehalogenase [Planctomycetes bacterium]|nr:haloalkane dehalogenase [Planctomycetota bacterium]
MKILETPNARFADLPDYPFEPHTLEVAPGLKMHYLDEGPREGPVVLLLHGEPSWSYLYRHVIPLLAAAGMRVLAPDLIGFGKSDKPSQQSDYTYARHVEWLGSWLSLVDVSDVTLFCQDWGGLTGLVLVAKEPERFARVMAANTGLPTGDHPMPKAFLAWQAFARESPKFSAGTVLQNATERTLTDAEVAAYDAPFPSDEHLAGARVFPALVPCTPDDPGAVLVKEGWRGLSKFEKPFRTAFSDGDPITKGGDLLFHKAVPGAAGQAHVTIKGGGHFLQEDASEELSRLLIEFVGRSD